MKIIPNYSYACYDDLWDQIFEDAEQPDAPESPEPIFWNKEQPVKYDENHVTCVMDQFVDPNYWTPKTLYAFKKRFKEEFNMKHEIRWIGIVGVFKSPGYQGPEYPDTGYPPRYDAAFIIHKEDGGVVGVGHRLDLGFRWFFDVIGQGDNEVRRFPLHFRRAYRDYPGDRSPKPTIDIGLSRLTLK